MGAILRPKRQHVTLTNIDIVIGTKPVEVRQMLSAITEAANNNALTEEDGSPHQRDQLAIVEILKTAALEIMYRSRRHWSGSGAAEDTTTVS